MEHEMNEIRSAIQLASWKRQSQELGVTYWAGVKDDWRILLCVAEGAIDGTATRASTIFHLTPELAELARQQVEG